MHKGERHTGKIPAAFAKTIKKTERLSTLRKELDAAISQENYELAATLRDRIHQLEKE